MLRENWNAHCDIAQPLESIARIHFHDQERPFDCFHDADFIESSTFVEVMLFLLRDKRGVSADITSFVNLVKPYLGLSLHEINNEKAQEVFEEFNKLYNN